MIRILSALLIGLLLSGCSRTVLSNLTPQHLPQNPSGIYTFTLANNADRHRIDSDTVRAEMVVNGEVIPMKPVVRGGSLYEVDFRMPAGQTEVRYFYRLSYDVNNRGLIQKKEYVSDLQTSRLVNRYVLSLESERGPVGATIAVMGRGFSQYDTIVVGATEAPTRYFSSNALQFTVPAVEGGRTYDVYLRTGNGDLLVGSFTVDASTLQVLPGSVDIASGQSTILVFSIDNEAPPGGLPVEVVTNVPESIVMPEVVIPSGGRSISVTVEGASPDTGKLVARAAGYKEVEIPVSVRY